MKKIFLLLGTLLVIASVSAQTQEEVQKIRAASNMDRLELLRLKFQAADKARKERVKRLAPRYNLPIYKPNSRGGYDQLIDVSEDGRPVYYTTSNADAAYSTRTNHLNSGGSLGLNLNGQNMTAYVWDGGPVRTTHQEFGGRVTIGDGVFDLNGNSDHATHVTGTIGAAGVDPDAQGMAPQSDMVTHDWSNDLTEATAAAMGGMLLSNHSYGRSLDFTDDWEFGAYINISHDWDDLMYNAPFYLMVKTAGNAGNNDIDNGLPLDGNAAFDKLHHRGTAKNNLVIANTQDADVGVNGILIDVDIRFTSSEGPTDDYRIKPDIAGNGTGVYSTLDGNDFDYASFTGTSMASPNIAGTLLLLQQHYNNLNGNFMRAATLKGLALHTADDAGDPGPDVIFGWGLLNALRAAETITQSGTNSLIHELTLTEGETHMISVTSDNINSLMASISWTDPPGPVNPGIANDNTPVLVNDLDIRVSQGGATYFPYRLTSVTTNDMGDNIVDPYERIDVAGASGTYDITITHKGALTNGSQNVSLVITGITDPTPVCNTDITITGNYNTTLTESGTWIVSSGQTIIENTAEVRLDADPTDGYVEFEPAADADYFLAEPVGDGVFVAEALDGCNILAPAKMDILLPDIKNDHIRNEDVMGSDPETEADSDLLPGGFALYQNIPNPFDKTTTINAVVPESANTARIVIYDLRGMEVESHTLSGRGNISIALSAERFSPGIYLYTLLVDGRVVDTKKMILTR